VLYIKHVLRVRKTTTAPKELKLDLELVGERLLLKELSLKPKESTSSGPTFIVPKSSTVENSVQCVVVKTTVKDSTLNAGDVVIIEKSNDYPTVSIDNSTHYFCQLKNILAKVN